MGENEVRKIGGLRASETEGKAARVDFDGGESCQKCVRLREREEEEKETLENRDVHTFAVSEPELFSPTTTLERQERNPSRDVTMENFPKPQLHSKWNNQ